MAAGSKHYLTFLTDGFIFLGLRDPQEGAVKKRNLKMYAFFFPRFCCFCCCFSLRHPKLLDKAQPARAAVTTRCGTPTKSKKKVWVQSLVTAADGRSSAGMLYTAPFSARSPDTARGKVCSSREGLQQRDSSLVLFSLFFVHI